MVLGQLTTGGEVRLDAGGHRVMSASGNIGVNVQAGVSTLSALPHTVTGSAPGVRGQLLDLESELIKVSANSIRLPAGFGDRLSLIDANGNGFLYQSGPQNQGVFLISVGNRAGLAPWLERELLLRAYGLGAALSEDAAGPNNSLLLDSRAGSWFGQGMLERDRESQTLVGSGARDSLLTMRLPGDLWQPGYNLWGLGTGSLVVNHYGSLQFWSLGQTLPDLLDFDLIATPTL